MIADILIVSLCSLCAFYYAGQIELLMKVDTNGMRRALIIQSAALLTGAVVIIAFRTAALIGHPIPLEKEMRTVAWVVALIGAYVFHRCLKQSDCGPTKDRSFTPPDPASAAPAQDTDEETN